MNKQIYIFTDISVRHRFDVNLKYTNIPE